MGLTPNAIKVLEARYLKKDEHGNPVESPQKMFRRVAANIAKVEHKHYGASALQAADWSGRFFELMASGKFLPNSPCLMNAGRPLQMLSACFVLPVEDAMSNGQDGIMDTLTHAAIIHKSGGGTGFSFGRLRPRGSMVASTTGVASGPVSFMELFDKLTQVVKQGGTRRGANMGVLPVTHPDILEFINCKRDTSKITNFNISVAVTDSFMDMVERGDEEAVGVWEALCDSAHATGEPGVIFIDEANRGNPVPHLGDYEASNPCSEAFLLPYDVCNLGSINLGKFVSQSGGQPLFDFSGFQDAIFAAVRFLDNCIDANAYPLPEIDRLAKGIRRIGLGAMGFGDMLIRLGIPYDSNEALEVADTVASFFSETAVDASVALADERGPYPEFEATKGQPGGPCHKGVPIRNCQVTMIAPTGTISIIAGCSGGIEPLFAVAFERNQAGHRMVDINPDFEAQAKREGWYSEDLMEEVARRGHCNFAPVPSDVAALYRTAHDVSPEAHIRMLATWQKYVDGGVSKTINLPCSATREAVASAYRLAYELNCKAVSVYRDGSRPEQVLSTGATGQDSCETEETRESTSQGACETC